MTLIEELKKECEAMRNSHAYKMGGSWKQGAESMLYVMGKVISLHDKPEDEGLLEDLAALEHSRWSKWQEWCHKILREHCPSEAMEIVLTRWDKQIATEYKDLSEHEKEMDRMEARKTLEVFSRHPTFNPDDKLEPSKRYKCPKCHTRFTREYPYKPSDTKESESLVELATPELIAELERRRPCEKCINGNFCTDAKCIWQYEFLKDNFKEKL